MTTTEAHKQATELLTLAAKLTNNARDILEAIQCSDNPHDAEHAAIGKRACDSAQDSLTQALMYAMRCGL